MKKVIIECDKNEFSNSDIIRIRKDMERIEKINREWAEGDHL